MNQLLVISLFLSVVERLSAYCLSRSVGISLHPKLGICGTGIAGLSALRNMDIFVVVHATSLNIILAAAILML